MRNFKNQINLQLRTTRFLVIFLYLVSQSLHWVRDQSCRLIGLQLFYKPTGHWALFQLRTYTYVYIKIYVVYISYSRPGDRVLCLEISLFRVFVCFFVCISLVGYTKALYFVYIMHHAVKCVAYKCFPLLLANSRTLNLRLRFLHLSWFLLLAEYHEQFL